MTLQLGNILLFDVKELADKFNLNPVTIRTYIKTGKLKGQKVGTKWYISEEVLREFFKEPFYASKRKEKAINAER